MEAFIEEIYFDNYPEPIPCELAPLRTETNPLRVAKLFAIGIDVEYFDLLNACNEIFIPDTLFWGDYGWREKCHFNFYIKKGED